MLTAKQNAFLEAMLTESAIESACKKARISKTTAYRFLRDVEFLEELQRRQHETIEGVVRFQQNNLMKCSEKLMQIIDDVETSRQIRINAISAFFTNYKTLIEMQANTSAMLKIAEIERRMNESKFD